MTRRPGLTLVEVLTALFILALGVIAILTMFPLGASQMAVAVRESRSAEAAFAADSQMRTHWKTFVVEQITPTEPYYLALSNPNTSVSAAFTVPSPLTALPPPPNATHLYPPSAGEPSYPVWIDPMGFAARSGRSDQSWIGEGPSRVPRRSKNSITSTQLAQRWCSAMDGLGYSDDGVPQSDREMRYNWLWIVQQPNISNPKTANMTIVVFDRRAHLYAPAGSETLLQSTNLGTAPGSNTVTFTSTPDIKAGAWIFDVTVTVGAGPGVSRIRNSNPYRVVAVNGNSVELQSPIKAPSDNVMTPYTGTFVVMRGVSGVYVRPQLTAGD